METQAFCPNCGKQISGSEKTNKELHCLSCNHVFEIQVKNTQANTSKRRSQARRNKRTRKPIEVARTSRLEAIKIKPKRSLYTNMWLGFVVVGILFIFIGIWLSNRTIVVEKVISISEKNLALPLDEIMQLSDQEIDLATVALKIAAEDLAQTYNKELNVARYLRKIDRFATVIQQNINDKMDPEDVIATIADFLYSKEKFVTSQLGWAPSNLYLNLILEGKQGYCLGFAQLWLALGERLQWRGKSLPLYGVYVPRHIFCRWHTKENYINIETLHVPPEDYESFLTLTFSRIFEIEQHVKREAARNLSDEFYTKMYQISKEAIKKGAYLKSLDKKAVISGIYSNRAGLQLDALQYTKSKEEYQGFLQRALHDNKKAENWSEDNILNFYNFALLCLRYFQDYQQAEKYGNSLVKFDPSAKHFIILAEIYAAQNKIKESIIALKRAKKAPLVAEKDYVKAIIVEAEIYSQSNQYDTFMKYCDSQIKQQEGNEALVLVLFSLKVKVYNKLKRYDKALGLAYLLIEELGEVKTLQLNLAETYREMSEWDKAEEIYDKILWHDWQNPEALHGKGLCLVSKNALSEALEKFEKAIIYEPWNKNLQKDLDTTKEKLENEK